MNLFKIIKSFYDKIFGKDQKLIESPKVDIENVSNNINKIRNEFEESLKVNLINNNVSANTSNINSATSNAGEEFGNMIESLQCMNDGLGFQKIKNY